MAHSILYVLRLLPYLAVCWILGDILFISMMIMTKIMMVMMMTLMSAVERAFEGTL